MSKTVNGVDVTPYVMKLSGKEYLQVQGRLVLLRSLHPDWSIQTELVKLENNNAPEDFAMFKAIILDGEGRTVATAYGSETRKGFPTGHIEKAETISVGRACLFAGIGMQYAEKGTAEDGAAKLADSPAPVPASVQRLTKDPAPETEPGGASDAQQKAIGKLIASLGWTTEGARGWVKKYFDGKTSRTMLTEAEANRALVALVARVEMAGKISDDAKPVIAKVKGWENYAAILEDFNARAALADAEPAQEVA